MKRNWKVWSPQGGPGGGTQGDRVGIGTLWAGLGFSKLWNSVKGTETTKELGLSSQGNQQNLFCLGCSSSRAPLSSVCHHKPQGARQGNHREVTSTPPQDTSSFPQELKAKGAETQPRSHVANSKIKGKKPDTFKEVGRGWQRLEGSGRISLPGHTALQGAEGHRVPKAQIPKSSSTNIPLPWQE